MKTHYEQPKKTPNDGPRSGYTETHPAYAQITASRCTGGDTVLYGSDFNHSHFVTISIRSSELNHHLSRDWHFARKEYVEVALSEAQWAAFVSSMNVGSGTPCTLRRREGAMVPQIPELPVRDEQFQDDITETLAIAAQGVKAMRAKIDGMSVSAKAKKELLDSLDMIDRNLGPNLGFVSKSFGEHMETVKEHAKTEVNAYVTGVVQRAGLAALRGEVPFSLEAPESPTAP